MKKIFWGSFSLVVALVAFVPLVFASGSANNTFEGGSTGATVTTGNSGGISGDAFDSVTIGSGATITYATTSAHANNGITLTTSGTAAQANVGWSSTIGSLSTHYGRLYLYVPSIPASNTRIFTALSGSTLRGAIQLGSNGKLRTFDANNSLIATTNTVVPTNTWVRVEWKFVGGSGSSGEFELKYYNMKDNSAPTETLTNTGLNTGGSVDTYRFGPTTSVSNITLSMDDIAIGQTAYLGATGYYNQVMADSPVSYWRLGESSGTTASDSSGNGRDGTYTNTPTLADTTDALLGDADTSVDFDGTNDYVEVSDNDVFTRPANGEITVEAWIRPDTLSMADQEGTGYVHLLGKGVSGQQEWTMRMYQTGNSENRQNRISFYAFNLSGGVGNGSYFQETVTPGEWIHVVGVINGTQIKIYKNGVLKDTDDLDQSGTGGPNITPSNGTAPVRIGTRDLASYWEGGIDEVAIYNTELTATRIQAHYNAR